MRATTVVLIAAGIYVTGRWAHNKDAVTIGSVASVVFLLIVIGLLDHGATEDVAKGFAWIILAVAILSDNSPVGPVANLIGSTLSNKPIKPGS